MFVAQVGFARDVSQDAITELLGTWWNNGQVVSHGYAIATTADADELSLLDRSLTGRGREICADITERTGIPTLYYLYGYRGVTECPSCGRPWRLPEPLMRIFDCRRDDCHLLSNVN